MSNERQVPRRHMAGPILSIHGIRIGMVECRLDVGEFSSLSSPTGDRIIEDMDVTELAAVIRALAVQCLELAMRQRDA
jgi:hypothetical protein